MHAIEERRHEIYDYFHANAACQNYFFDPAREKEYVAYFNSMYLLQDTSQSLSRYLQKGSSNDPQLAYLEFCGVMQSGYHSAAFDRGNFQGDDRK